MFHRLLQNGGDDLPGNSNARLDFLHSFRDHGRVFAHVDGFNFCFERLDLLQHPFQHGAGGYAAVGRYAQQAPELALGEHAGLAQGTGDLLHGHLVLSGLDERFVVGVKRISRAVIGVCQGIHDDLCTLSGVIGSRKFRVHLIFAHFTGPIEGIGENTSDFTRP